MKQGADYLCSEMSGTCVILTSELVAKTCEVLKFIEFKIQITWPDIP